MEFEITKEFKKDDWPLAIFPEEERCYLCLDMHGVLPKTYADCHDNMFGAMGIGCIYLKSQENSCFCPSKKPH